MSKIVFSTEKVLVNDLIDHRYNPRILTKKQFKDLKKSFEKFSYVELVAINKDKTIIAGHQRIAVMKELGMGETLVEVRVPNRQLTDKEADEYLIRSNVNGGSFDFDSLANNFESTDLMAWGFDEKVLLDNFDPPDFDEVDEENSDDLTKNKDTSKKCPKCGHEF